MPSRDNPVASSSSPVARPTGGPKGVPKKPPIPLYRKSVAVVVRSSACRGAQDTPSVRLVVLVGGTPRIGELESLNSGMMIAPMKRPTIWVVSSKTLSRTYCLQCGNFINEEPQEDRKKKKSSQQQLWKLQMRI